ncbi:MAG: class I SAM-dependent methyltransferase, partial [Bacteroidota bacterium]
MSNTFEGLHQEYFRRFYQFSGQSKWMEKIWSEALGESYPKETIPYSYVTREDLDCFADWLNLVAGTLLADIGCGRGGPGLKLAERLQVQLVGVDIAPEAVEQA